MARTNSLFIILVLAIIGLAFALPTVGIQLGLHAHENPAHLASDVRTTVSTCPQKYTAEMYSEKRDTWMYLCFVKDTGKVALWILTDKMTKVWREITAFFPRTPTSYIPAVIVRDGYRLVSGELPEWVLEGIKKLEAIQ